MGRFTRWSSTKIITLHSQFLLLWFTIWLYLVAKVSFNLIEISDLGLELSARPRMVPMCPHFSTPDDNDLHISRLSAEPHHDTFDKFRYVGVEKTWKHGGWKTRVMAFSVAYLQSYFWEYIVQNELFNALHENRGSCSRMVQTERNVSSLKN